MAPTHPRYRENVCCSSVTAEVMGKNWKQLVAGLGLELIEVDRRAGGKDVSNQS